MITCSEQNCNLPAIRQVKIKGDSFLINRGYKVHINLCELHYNLENNNFTLYCLNGNLKRYKKLS